MSLQSSFARKFHAAENKFALVLGEAVRIIAEADSYPSHGIPHFPPKRSLSAILIDSSAIPGVIFE